MLKMMTAGAVAGLLPKGARAGEAKALREEITWSRRVPVRYTADVAVIGGGIAGVAAACAAAKSGAKVVLVERFAITGGNLTTGGVASFCGETAGQGEVFDGILADMEKFNAVAPYKPYPQLDHRVFDHHILAIALQELLLRRKVKLLLHTRFVDVRVTDSGRITECIVCGKSGPEALRAKQFIDRFASKRLLPKRRENWMRNLVVASKRVLPKPDASRHGQTDQESGAGQAA
jgi:flavin-dependent dehydrogenase